MALFSSSRPGIRGRVVTKFPAQVLGGTGITVTRANGIYTFTLGLDSFAGAVEGTFMVRGPLTWGGRTIVGSDLPAPSAVDRGGVFALPVASNSVLSGIGVDGTPTRATTTGTGAVVRTSSGELTTPNFLSSFLFAGVKLYDETGSFRTFYHPDGSLPLIQANATDLFLKSDVLTGTSSDATATRFRWTNTLLQLGGSDSAAPVGQTIQCQGVVTGTANAAGVNLAFNGSLSTGTGQPGSMIFQTGFAAAGSASTPNAVAAVLTLGPSSLLGANTGVAVDHTQTWNTSGVATAFRFSVTDTASAATSRIFDFRGGSGGTTSLFAMGRAGELISLGAQLVPMMLPSVAVDFNAANTDHAITITLPAGHTRYRLASVVVVNTGTTASLTTATAGLFTDAAGAGTALVASGTALSPLTSNAVGTNGAVFVMTTTVGTAWLTDTTLFFRVQTQQGAAASGSVTLQIFPVP